MAPIVATNLPSVNSSSVLETPKHTTTRPSLSSSSKRKLQVYVEIPPSPLHSAKKKNHEAFRTHRYKQTGSKVPPLSHKQINKPPFVELLLSSGTPVKKKPRLSQVEVVIVRDSPARQGNQLQTANNAALGVNSKSTNAGSQAPPKDTTIRPRCHQCGQMRDEEELIYCSRSTCRLRYCGGCLRNRYAQSLSAVKDRGIPDNVQERSGHNLARGYIWSCFKCCKCCNCSLCRKSQGLEPLGKDKTLRFVQPLTSSSMTNNPDKPVSAKRKDDNGAKVAPTKPKPAAPRKRKAVPQPNWHAVPSKLSYGEVENRTFIREFVLRFEQLMDVSTARLEELDQFEPLSLLLVKSLLQNFLNLIAADVAEEPKRIIKNTVRQLSSVRQSPALLWTPIEDLRSSLASSSFPLNISEPAAPSTRASSRADSLTPPPLPPTRTLPSRASKLSYSYVSDPNGKAPVVVRRDIVDTEQFVPVLISLVHTALQLPSCRAEIENGVNDVKEENRRYWAALKEENERWAEESSALTEDKAKGADMVGSGFDLEAWTAKFKAAQVAHKQAVASLENEHNLKCQAWQPRFAPLGKDMHGRVYFAGTAFTGKIRCTLEEAGEFNRWGWFLAVWGKGNTSSEQDSEKWWGFHDPAEIRKLAKWVSATAFEEEEQMKKAVEEGRGDPSARDDPAFLKRAICNAITNNENDDVDEDDPTMVQRKEQVERRRLPTYKETSDLVKSLNTYANMLEARFSGGK